MDELTRRVRHQVFTFYLENSRPPTVKEITAAAKVTENEANDALKKLEDTHHIVLHKAGVDTTTPICMAHPFSHLPTPYVVRQGARSWWANCPWCGFGLAAMLVPSGTPVTLDVTSGSIGDEMHFTVDQDGIKLEGTPEQQEKCVVHYSAPPSTWWIDVKYACGTFHIFKDEQEARDWCDRYGFKFGDVMNLDVMWKLAKSWYADKATYGYERKSKEEVEKLYTGLGMTSNFWSQ